MILSPHHQQRILATFADIVINGERIFTSMLHLHLFTRPFWIVQTNKQNAVTFKGKSKKKTKSKNWQSAYDDKLIAYEIQWNLPASEQFTVNWFCFPTKAFLMPIPLTVTFVASALKTGRAGPFLLPFECFATVWTDTFVDSWPPSSTSDLPNV